MNHFNGKEKSAILDDAIVSHLAEVPSKGELAIVFVGNNPSSEKYTNLKKKYCDSVGIKCVIYQIDDRLSDEYILQDISEIFLSSEVTGGIIQLPLPRKSLDSALGIIPREKDIDVISPASTNAFYSDEKLVRLPPVIRTLELFIQETGKTLVQNKLKATVIGEGNLVGKPAAHFLMNKGYEVEIINDYKKGNKLVADLLILSAGVPFLVSGEDISAGCDVIDFGAAIVDGKTVGDLDKDSPLEHLGLVSMSPGGAGPLVVRFLIMNFLGI